MIYFSYTLRLVVIGAGFIGFVAGMLSVFFVNRKQGILGDAIAHASLAGIVAGFMILGEKNKLFLLTGALVSAFLAIFLIQFITHYSKLKSDAAIGIILSLFFGVGIMLLSYVQQLEIGSQAGLRHYLFGNIAYLRFSDLPLLLALGLVNLVIIVVFWKELKLVTFDKEFAKIIGLHVERYELLIMSMGVSIIVIGVDLLGVVMMAGLLLAPAIAARQWFQVYGRVILFAGVTGALSGIIGTILSANIENLPPGPTIILVLGVIVLLSIIFSSKGLIIYYLRFIIYQLRYSTDDKIRHLADHMRLNPAKCDIREFDINPLHDDFPAELHSSDVEENHKLYDDLDILMHLGFIKPREGKRWILTYKGMDAVTRINEEVKI